MFKGRQEGIPLISLLDPGEVKPIALRQKVTIHLGTANDENGAIGRAMLCQFRDIPDHRDALTRCHRAAEDDVSPPRQWSADGLKGGPPHEDRMPEGRAFEELQILWEMPGQRASTPNDTVAGHGDDGNEAGRLSGSGHEDVSGDASPVFAHSRPPIQREKCFMPDGGIQDRYYPDMETTRPPSPTHHLCAVTGLSHPVSKLTPLRALQPSIAQTMRERHPELNDDSLLSMEAVNAARLEYVRALLEKQVGDLTKLDEEVVESLHKQQVLSERPLSEDEEVQHLTLGQRMADRIADFGGSWTFILTFCGFLVLWIVVNAGLWLARPFDPYPFILLNLMLSFLASLQAPVIMMSQNRQEARDRQHAEGDYKVNLKAELEIRHLHEKMDYLLHQHATRLMEVQQIQIELLRELAHGRETRRSDG